MRITRDVLRRGQTDKSAPALAFRSAGARALTLPLQAIASLVTAGLLIRHYGTESYGQYALVISLLAVLPFADLGIGAAVVNATATTDTEEERRHAIAVISAAFRVLVLVAVTCIGAGLVITCTFGWAKILGGTADPRSNAAIFFCLTIFACALPLSLGQRIALGIGANDKQLLVQGCQPLLTMALIVLCVNLSLDIQATFLSFFTAYFITIAIIAFAADRWCEGMLREALRQAFSKHRGTTYRVQIFATALPMCVVMVGLPLVLQTHRLMLSHFGNAQEVAQYSLAAQMYLPVLAVISAASTSLWAVFARERAVEPSSQHKRATKPFKISSYTTVGATVICALVTLIAPWLAPRISGGQISVDLELALSFSIFVIAQAAQFPLGVYLTDVFGLRLQAFVTLLFVPLVWVAAVGLIPLVGAGAPALATGAVGLVVQVVPFMVAVYIVAKRGERKVGLASF